MTYACRACHHSFDVKQASPGDTSSTRGATGQPAAGDDGASRRGGR
jgi:hypothetical protein